MEKETMETAGSITDLADSKDLKHIDIYEYRKRNEIVISIDTFTDLAILGLIILTGIELIIIISDYFKKGGLKNGF